MANVIAIVPVRSGSTELPNKNIRSILGRTLLEHNIRLLKQSSTLNRIIVSTDSEQYADIARKAGAEAPFLRPSVLSQKYSSTEDVLSHCLNWLKENQGESVDIVVFQQVNDLFKRAEWIDMCVSFLIDNPDYDSAFVAKIEEKNFWYEDETGSFKRLSNFGHTPRQLKKKIYREDTGLACATRPHIILDQGRRLGDKVKIFPHKDFTVDIHNEFDLNLARVVVDHFPEVRSLIDPGSEK